MVSFIKKIFCIFVIVTGISLGLHTLVIVRTSRGYWVTRQLATARERDTALLNALFPAQTQEITVTSGVPVLRTRRKRRLTIGIPAVKRRDGNYFFSMLDSMLNKTSPEHLNEIVFVVFLAENNNLTWKHEMEKYLKKKYHSYIEAGSLFVIQAPLSFYNTMPKFGNNHYINWRTKQNFDYAYLMKASLHLSQYYMQLEDDVITKDGYYPAILDYIKRNRNKKWVCLEFCMLGFIGKLFRSSNVVRLADMLLMFNSTMPVDYTFGHFNYLAGQEKRFLRKPTLFNHLGLNSSLAGKIQPLEDIFFEYPEKELNGDNPPARIHTSLKINSDLPPEMAYKEVKGYFWSDGAPKLNDHFTVVFRKPQLLKGVIIVTGRKSNLGDILYSAVVEASSISNGKNDCDEYDTIGRFEDGVANMTETSINAIMSNFKTVCLRIRVEKPQFQWVIIKEIAVFVK